MIGGAKGIGLGIDLGLVNQYNRTGSQSYIEPEVLDSLVGVWSAYGMTNDSPNRSTIKNKLSNKGGDFVISNAAFKLNSGFGEYSADFESFDWAVNISQKQHNKATISLNGRLCNHTAIEVDEMKVNIIGNVTELIYWYIANPDDTTRSEIRLTSGINTLPKSYAKDDGQTYNIGFAYISGDSEITIEQIPSFEGAFVTDGIDDLITSTKTVQEMLGGSTEFTAVSMIHLISPGQDVGGTAFTNYIRTSDNHWTSNRVSNTDKTGIYGYSFKQGTPTVINNILGDKNDYTVEKAEDVSEIFRAKFSVEGFEHVINGAVHVSSVAWYWTIIANKVLTTDQINQVITYFNLDRTLKFDIYCNIAKQGITNENHTEFGDKLIDFSGNGRDIQLNNIAWNKESGIDDNGALYLDGVNDFGQFVGDLGLKDYTFIMDREYLSLKADQVPVISSINPSTNTPFIFEHCVYENRVARPFSFGKDTVFEEQLVSKRLISYQSTYKYNGKDISKGTSVNTGNGFTIGRYGDDRQYTNFALYFLMLFPYSMSEFLIERQLKKHKLGTLYPDMVEFRPVIKANNDYEIVYTAIIKPDNWQEISVGDYVTVGESVAIQIKLNNPLEVTNVSSNSLADVSFYKEETGDNVYTIYGRLLDGKSPQKISLTIEQDENYVLFNPTINSNAIFEVGNEQNITELTDKVRNHEIDGFIMYLSKRESKYILPNSWINKDTEVIASIYCLDNTLQDDLHINIDGNSKYCLYAGSSNNIAEFIIMDDNIFEEQYITNVLTANTIDIQLDQYIRYEDIVQPYPVLLRFNDENGNEVSWGGKFRVGSTITRIGSIADPESNLLNGLYSVSGLSLNGKAVTSSTSIVEKQMVFKTTATYLLDDNEPKCILSPIRLRMPNSSYKILGYIPDISGNGNHGKINNSAYAGMSGANGYLQNFSDWTKVSGVSSTDSVISSSQKLVAANAWIAYVTSGTVIPTFKVKISGIPVNGNLRFEGSDQALVNGVNTIQGITATKITGFYISSGNDNDWSNLKIEQIGEYEGAYCLDGVDDLITIPTLSSGGKQVLMKVNWQDSIKCIYDQRIMPQAIYPFAIYVGIENSIAYSHRNDGKTYIDGILNTNILSTQLQGITHNITAINEEVTTETSTSPVIGAWVSKDSYFSKMSLYDFMLFDEISTEDKIKELNEYVGIEAKVELPPYYFDTHGKTNLDEDRDYISNLGTVEDVIEVSQPAIFAENWYDGNPEPVLSSPIINQTDYSIEVKANKMDNNFNMMLDVECDTPLPAFKAKFSMVGTAISVDLKYYINGGSKIIDVFKSGGSTEPVILDIPASERSFIYGTNTDNYPNILIEVLPSDNSARYGLSNKNFAYDKMSGFGGYEFAKFDNTVEWNLSNPNGGIEVVSRNGYSCTFKRSGNSVWDFGNSASRKINKDLHINVKCDKSIKLKWQFKYKSTENPDKEITVGLVDESIGNTPKSITLPHKTDEELTALGAIESSVYYLIYFDSTELPIGEEYTVEMLPLYPNGLVYDGVTDYSECVSIPAFTDYTYVFKRELLDASANTCSMYKGTLTEGSRTAFVSDYDKNNEIGGRSFGNYIAASSLRTNKIIYGTKASVNGDSIVPGNNVDALGLVLGKYYDSSYKKLVFYKLILYPKTIPLLQINFLKNLMEKDEIIDLNNKIFIQE